MKTIKMLKRIFLWVFAISFGVLFINIAVVNTAFDCFSPLLVVGLTLASAGLLFLLFYLLKRWERFFTKHSKIVLLVLLGFSAVAMFVVGLGLRFNPAFDLGAIFWGGASVAESGNLGSHTEYFAMFSNNLGGLMVFTLLFSFCRLVGITDYYVAALVLNIIGVLVSQLLVYLCARRRLGMAPALLCLFVCLLLPSFYAFGATFYTDILSMPFAILTFYLYLRLREEKGQRRVWFAVLAGLSAGAGMLIKGTVAIVLVAIVLDLLFHGFKKAWAPALYSCTAAVLLVVSLSAVAGTLLPPGLAEQKGIPVNHWVAMSAHGSGTYNGQDYEDAKALPSKTERSQANWGIIAQRYQENGFTGTIALWNSKLVRSFGNGTFSVSDFLDDSPAQYGFLQHAMLKEGDHYSVYCNICQGVYVAVMLLAVTGAVGSRVRKRAPLFVPYLCLFGLLIFLAFWEASARYVTNFLPFMLLCGAQGVEFIYSLTIGKVQKRADEHVISE